MEQLKSALAGVVALGMKRLKLALIGVAGLVLGGLYLSGSFSGSGSTPSGAAQAQAPGGAGAARRPAANVVVAKAEEKSVGYRFDVIGSVQAISTVTLRARTDSSVITGVHVKDGAIVKQGDLLFTLDSRQVDAQVRQAEGQLARNVAALEGAKRDVARLTELVARDATSRKTLDDARTAAAGLEGQIIADQANLENLRVQQSYTKIAAPISGRIGAVPLKVGNLVRIAEATLVLGTINQIAPIYVAFGVPQRLFNELREADRNNTARIEVSFQGSDKVQVGKLAVIDNTIDNATGMITVRAEMPNADESLWPGAIVNVRLVLRDEQRVVVPMQAVQSSQRGTYVFIADNGKAVLRPVTVNRSQDGLAVMESGLKAGETVVTEGQLVIVDGSAIQIREQAKAGS